MKYGRFIFMLVLVFVLITLVTVFMQYNSSHHINGLITGNEKLLAEFNTDRDLRDIRSRMLSMENNMQQIMGTGDTSELQMVRQEIQGIELTLQRLNLIKDDDSTERLVDQLEDLLKKKIFINSAIIESILHPERTPIKQQDALALGKHLTDSVARTITRLESTRQAHLEEIIKKLDDNGRKASLSGYIFLSFVLLITILAFLFIINKIKQQQDLIRELHDSRYREREAARVKENFLANMSHEIRTPMNAIVGFTGLLSRRELDEKSREYVAAIKRSGENLLSIINDILDLSRIEAGMLRIESTVFSIREVIHSVEVLFREKALEKGLTTSYVIAENIPDQLLGDPFRLTQVLVNLVGNAIKFTDKGSVTIEVEAMQDNDRITASFKIKDTGIGIPAEVLPEIFDRFRQAEDSSTRNYGGTGLGLSIVRHLIHLQNGQVSVQSEPGKGTQFIFSLPFTVADKSASGVDDLTPKKSQALKPDFRILVVEDNEINRQLLRHLFEEWKIDYLTAGNGREALELLRSEKIDLILMDIQMPVMDGYETSLRIRNELHLSTPIIAMTAHAMAGDREKCLQHGMNDHLAKPVQEDQLSEMIRRYIPNEVRTTSKGDASVDMSSSAYHTINLGYMKEISKGNVEYEKIVTAEFLRLCPEQLRELSASLENNDYTVLRTTAHDLKTTVSIMGLSEELSSSLDLLEDATTNDATLKLHVQRVIAICQRAIDEARHFKIKLEKQAIS